MSYQLKYDERLKGNSAVAAKSGAQVLTSFLNSGTAYSYNAGVSAGYCTGYYYENGDAIYAQLLNGYFAVVPNIYSPDWDFMKTEKAIAQYSQSQAQAQVNKIIKNNIKILCNNLICARYADRLTKEQQSHVRTLQNRMSVRNSALKNAGLCEDVQTSYPDGYAELSSYLDRLMSGGGVGVATWVVVVIAATIVAATATAAYVWYKSLADESEKDVKFSQELTRTLTSKLTQEEYEQLRQETKGIVTRSRIKQFLSDGWGTIKTLLIGGIAAYIAYDITKFYNHRKQQ